MPFMWTIGGSINQFEISYLCKEIDSTNAKHQVSVCNHASFVCSDYNDINSAMCTLTERTVCGILKGCLTQQVKISKIQILV